MPFRKKLPPLPTPPETPPLDSTAWLVDSSLAEFLLLHTAEIKYMAMFGYAFYHGSHLFGTFPSNASDSYKFVTMILKCTGGGILVPLCLNLIPYPLLYDSYAMAVLLAFALHNYYPVLREVYHLSTIVKVPCIVLYECVRAYVVVSMTAAGARYIPPSEFAVPVFGPIICGTIGGCGYKFVPLNQGVTPLLEHGLMQPMLSALLGSIFFYAWTLLFPNLPRSHDKGQVLVAIFFIAYNLSTTFKATKKTKKE